MVLGNYIGTDSSGQIPLGNTMGGVTLGGPHSVVQANVIAYSVMSAGPGGGSGVSFSPEFDCTIRRNSIHHNAGAGIEGATEPPAPIITAVGSNTLAGTACPGCEMEVFSDSEDEGRVFEGSTVADRSGGFAFSQGSGRFTESHVTATATDGVGRTSAYSVAVPHGGTGAGPTILTVVNAAHDQTGFASQTWMAIKGTNLAPTTRTWQASDFTGNSLPTRLDGVSANINGKPAPVHYISPTQINVLAPDDAALGPVPVEVITPQGRSTPVMADRRSFAPGWFMFDPEGRKYIAAVHLDGVYLGKPGLYPSLNFRAAKPGDVILLYATGFGPVDPPTPSGQLVSQPGRLRSPVVVRIGGVVASVAWAGLVASGEYQFNVTVPDVPNGDQPVIAEIGGATTQSGAFITVQR